MNAERVTLIAEIGSNYDGDLDLAKRYIEASAKAGADIAKFQSLSRDGLIARRIKDPGSDDIVDNPKYAAFGNQGLPDDWHYTLKACADDNGIEFMSSPFSLEAVDLLEDVGVSRYKIASGDMTFRAMQEKIAATGKAVIQSTGASYLDEVEAAASFLRAKGCNELTLLHCTASYPPAWEDMNLNALTSLRAAFPHTPLGLSDHSPGSLAPIASIALGARVIEKHVTFDRSNPGPDHPFAMEMEEFARMAHDITDLCVALGSSEKRPAASEINRRRNLRRGLYDAEHGGPTTGNDGVWLRPQHAADDRAE
ncbi:N-acetylneuraminate synthase family protein [Maricaulis sp.]|uniref:N-acetylneuraminate synthase family protein n=1 Tax=unclassified Maricaulis TaxID=2632371 RepID=UPI001B2B5BDF|nr:N-acetylneuraminate synthase family protein [Maricaulis sp.]MBO6796786.1 N-acetylneuraminate synthase family protein [Maricaulis sp.]